MLQQAYALSLLRPLGERGFIKDAYAAPFSGLGTVIHIPCSASNKMYRNVSYTTPNDAGLFHRETPIAPLADALGVEQFLLVLSAVLCERHIVFVADDVGTLSVNMLNND